MLKNALMLDGVKIPAVCDIVPEKVEQAQNLVEKAGHARPVGFTGPEDYRRVAELKNIDAVFTATPWKLHTPVMVAAMKGGKYGGTEMPACDGHDEAWELVETAEKTGMHCMLMENYTYMRNVMMVLNMVRLGMFGELTHAETGYQHDVRYATIGPRGELLWRAHERYLNNTGNRYPTHAIGPVAQWININRGNRFEYLVSMSSNSRGLHEFAGTKYGPDHPLAKQTFANGDVNTSLIKTVKGRTIVLGHNCDSPRPYSRMTMIQGTKGIARKYPRKMIYIEGRTEKEHSWENLDAYYEEFEHPLWKAIASRGEGCGHGGMDFIEDYRLIECLRKGEPMDMDVYDAAAWSVISALSEKSVAHRSRAVDFPDFTRGQWKSRQPLGIITA